MNMDSNSLETVAFWKVQVAGLLLRHWLEGSGAQERRLGIHPMVQAVEHLKPQAVLVAALRALQAASQVRDSLDALFFLYRLYSLWWPFPC